MNKPPKRHARLIEFSKDHYFGMLLIWKIRQAIKNNIEIERVGEFIKRYATADTLPHLEEEEKYLLPLLSPNDILKIQIIKAHKELRKILSDIFENNFSYTAFEKFATLLEAHILYEEREFFQHLQSKVDLDTAHCLEGKKDRDLKALEEQWKDKFWESIPGK